jgi:hypothetical protein
MEWQARDTAAFVTRRGYPAVGRGAANHEPLRHRVSWLAGFNRYQHALA